jgi:serine/threonine protein phosphatase 1
MIARKRVETRGRCVAIGDIHGCSMALAALLAAIDPQSDDTIVTLGDYIDRGIDSKGVLDQLIQLQGKCKLVPLLGNHEEMLLGARHRPSNLEFFLACGGIATLQSYGDSQDLDAIPPEHFAFLEQCQLFHIEPGHLFAHANYPEDKTLDAGDRPILLWVSLRDDVPGPHCSGRTAILGHTPQLGGDILDLGYLKCIDTGCAYGGWLTALEVHTGQLWQFNEAGQPRNAEA